MQRSIFTLVCVAVLAFGISQPSVSEPIKKLPVQPAPGQQSDAVCGALPNMINGRNGVAAAIKQARAKVELDVTFSAGKPAPTYSVASRDQIDGAAHQIDVLNGIIGTNQMTYALAGGSVFGYMTDIVERLQRAQWQTLASASNNQSAAGLESFKAIVTAITRAKDTATEAGRCYMSPYVGL